MKKIIEKVMCATKRQVGQAAEQKATRYLRRQGLRLVETNYCSRWGEIDLIMRAKDVLVFVEVRMRNRPAWGTGLESVDHRKQEKIRKTAKTYLQQHRLLDKVMCRFDVVDICQQHIRWVKNAFS